MDQGACPWGRKEWDMTKHLTQSNYTQFAKEFIVPIQSPLMQNMSVSVAMTLLLPLFLDFK